MRTLAQLQGWLSGSARLDERISGMVPPVEPPAPNGAPAAAPAAIWIGSVALALALAVVIGRATVLETLRDAFRAPPGADAIPLSEAGPAGSLVLDLISFLPALLLLFRRAIWGGPRLIVRWPQLLLGAFALTAITSILWADDKFAALVNSLNLAAAAALFFTASQVVRDGRTLRQVAGVMLGLLMI